MKYRVCLTYRRFEKGLQTRISNEMEEMHEQQDAIEANVRMLTER